MQGVLENIWNIFFPFLSPLFFAHFLFFLKNGKGCPFFFSFSFPLAQPSPPGPLQPGQPAWTESPRAPRLDSTSADSGTPPVSLPVLLLLRLFLPQCVRCRDDDGDSGAPSPASPAASFISRGAPRGTLAACPCVPFVSAAAVAMILVLCNSGEQQIRRRSSSSLITRSSTRP